MTDHCDCNAPANDCRDARFPARRGVLQAAFVAGIGLSLPRAVLARADEPNRKVPPTPGDVFVFVMGDRAGETIAPGDLPLGGPQVAAWPKDPKAKLVRNGSPVTGWVKDKGTMVLKCFCHLSEYDPRRSAAVVSGPALHPLAALPVAMVGGTLTVAGKFV